MTAWVLLVLWSNHDLTIRHMPTELACDAHRAAVVRTAYLAEYIATQPKAVSAACVAVTDDFITEGR